MKNYTINAITNGAEEFGKIVFCFHGFNGDKWGDVYNGLKHIIKDSLLVSFNSCGHGDSEVSSIDMKLDLILEEIDVVVDFFRQQYPNKPVVFVAGSYGAYRVMNYLIKYKPEIRKIVYINPAFKILKILEMLKEFKYSELKDDDFVPMKRSLNKFMKKEFLDDLFENNLYAKKYDLDYDTKIVVGSKDTLIPIEDTLEIAEKYNYDITYVDDEHCFENEDNWKVVLDLI